MLKDHDFNVRFIRHLVSTGKVKSKGAYEVADFDKIGWHKNQSAMVVPLAVLSHLIGLEDYVSFVKNHKDIYDFMLRAKIPRSSRLVLVDDYGVDIPQQNICRYYPSKKGGSLVKIMPALKLGEEDRRLSIDKEWKVKTCNNILDFDGDIDYDYYITEIEKLIEPMKKDVSEDTPF